MAFRKILKYPDRGLLKKSVGVNPGDDVSTLVNDLIDTLKVANGVGLSAPQIGFYQRVVYIKTPEFSGEMINPEIVEVFDREIMSEGCLSFPGIYQNVERYSSVLVKYSTLAREERQEKFTGLAAQVIQHEIEHLDGRLMVDHMSRLKRQIISRKIAKAQSQVSKLLFTPDPTAPRRVKKGQHLSSKEKKKRRLRRKRNR